ncbi:MAG TPA: response regulator transcription factor [Candidatus Acidoferrales bacterium]|jgi:DNA-binding NarL/FixJ family response regulator|nr:response regulator transcription factor [Candidatus Acidoferrales bacterium]
MSIRILLADDHVETRQATRRLLAGHPDWVVCGEVDNGIDAVEKVATLKPDLVILDLSMPKMNGIEAAKVIHAADPKLPLLLFSVNGGDAQIVEQIRTAGFRGAVAKTTPWLLPEAVSVLLQGKTFLDGNSAALAAPLAETEAIVEAATASASAAAPEEARNAKQAVAGAEDSGKPIA